MKKITILAWILCVSLFGEITLTSEDEKNWHVESIKAQEVSYVPLGEYMMSVITPQKLLHTVSVAHEANIVKVEKSNFEVVKRGEILLELSSPTWIEVQKEFIATSIELMQNKDELERKVKLCKEGIIAQKECILAESEFKKTEKKLLYHETILKTYGANDEMVRKISKDLSIFQTLKVRSPIDGTLLQVNVQSGENVSASTPLFLIKAHGANSLESELPKTASDKLKASQEVVITIQNKNIRSKVMLLSKALNPLNQSRYVRFWLQDEDEDLPSGLKIKTTLSIPNKAFAISKKAVVQSGNESIIFIKDAQTYKTLKVELLWENDQTCYLRYNEELKKPIVITGTSILQNMTKLDK